MSEDRSRALVPMGPNALAVTSRLAERTLAERAQRSDAIVVSGRTLVVGPGGYATIGEAVAEARDGDTVLVRPGTYRETVTITRAITLRGDGDREQVVVEFEGAECLVLHETTAAVTNMTFRGGGTTDDEGWDAAIRIVGGAPTLSNLELVESCGIVVGQQGSPVIRGCVIRDGQGPGIVVHDAAAPRIEDNEIFGNALPGIVVGGEGTAPLIRKNTIRDGQSGGISVHDAAAGTIEANEIFGNTGTGIMVLGAGTAPLIRKNTIRDGQANGVSVHDAAAPRIEANEIFGNAFAGIAVGDKGTAPVIRKNTIRDGRGGGILVYDAAAGTIEGNRIFGNALADIQVSEDSTPYLHGNRLD